jgi:hypothetical protein
MPSYALLVALCAGAAALFAQALETSMADASGYLAVSLASAAGVALRFRSEVFRR